MDVLPAFQTVTDLQCPGCGGAVAACSGGRRCHGCGADYPDVLGVPFLGAYEPRDMLGLIEIAANASERASLPLAPETVERIDALCAGFHATTDKDAFRAAQAEARAPWFENRYHEWLGVNALLQGVDLTGCHVLDIGAGQGFDAWRLALRGARVTAVEFSPLLCEAGSRSFPGMRWIGGFGHALPFADASFDHVFVNAALHHMQDIPATIAEALRVLRPGGLLITSGDPFRADATGPELEYVIFDRHAAVLRGINEQIPPLSDFLATIERNRAILAPELFTETLHATTDGSGAARPGWTAWDFDRDRARLKRHAGGLAMRIRLLAPWPHPRGVQRDGVLAPATYAQWLEDPATVLAFLARLVPSDYVDAPFPGTPTKFDLLNGWRVAQTTGRARTGYYRARLYRTRPASGVLALQIRAATPGPMAALVNGRQVATTEVGDAWRDLEIDLSGLPKGETCLVELRRLGEPADFDAGCFEVRLPGAAAVMAAFQPRYAFRYRVARALRRLAGMVPGLSRS